MIWIVVWLLVCFVVVLAFAVRANEKEIVQIRKELAENGKDDLK